MTRGLIWQFTKQQFADLVKQSSTFVELTKLCGYTNVGGGYRMVKKRIQLDKIDDSHIAKGLDANKGKCYQKFTSIPIDELLVENSNRPNSTVRRYVIKQKILPYICSWCGIGPKWNGKPLTLTLDHINGINSDHRKHNLRFLCPNCNSQTETYGGRNIHWPIKAKVYKIKVPQATKCPPIAELQQLILTMPATAIAKRYGVSDKAVSKWCKKHSLEKPGPGFWTKKKMPVGIGPT